MLREWRFILLSAGVHAAIAVGALTIIAFHWVGGRLLVAQSSHRDTIDVEIREVAPMALPQVRPPPPDLPPSEAVPSDDPQRVAGEVARPGRERTPGEPGNVEPPPNAQPQQGPRSDEYDPLPPSGVLTVPGLDGPKVWAMPGAMPEPPRSAPAPTTTPRPREVDKDIAGKVIREAMKDRDKSKGIEIAAAGTAASAVQAALYGSDLPSESRGTIAIQLDGSGNVVGVKVVSMVGGTADQWERAAQNAAAQVRSRKNTLPDEYKKGAIVYIDARSVEQLPAGKGSGISGNTATFDVSNIGAHKRQVVRVATRVVAVR